MYVYIYVYIYIQISFITGHLVMYTCAKNISLFIIHYHMKDITIQVPFCRIIIVTTKSSIT